MLSCNWKRRNFSGYKDGIAVLTHTAWAAISTSVSKVSYDLQLRRGIDSPRFCIYKTLHRTVEHRIYEEYRSK